MYLPFLADTSTTATVEVAQLLGSSLRLKDHRTAVTEWQPTTERPRDPKGKRGWEIPSSLPSKQGGWAIRHLVSMLKSGDPKVILFNASVLWS